MAQEYPALDISRDPELVKLAEEVSKTKKAQTIRLSDDVIAVVKPEKRGDPGKARRRGATTESSLPTTYTLESAFGSVPIPPQLQGKEIEEIIREAKEEHAERVMRE
jgi:hypothetical protein